MHLLLILIDMNNPRIDETGNFDMSMRLYNLLTVESLRQYHRDKETKPKANVTNVNSKSL